MVRFRRRHFGRGAIETIHGGHDTAFNRFNGDDDCKSVRGAFVESLITSMLEVRRGRRREGNANSIAQGRILVCPSPCVPRNRKESKALSKFEFNSFNDWKPISLCQEDSLLVCCLSRARYGMVHCCSEMRTKRFRNFWWRCHKFWSRSWLMRSYRYAAVNLVTSRQKVSFFCFRLSISFSL